MTWKKSGILTSAALQRAGLTKAVTGGVICREAERLYPNLFTAVSFREGVLHLAVPIENRLQVKLIEGALFKQLNLYCGSQKLPSVTRIRLTNQDKTVE